ncbi:MAG TPA: alpha/beta hydrolase [Ktedonobacteraceae bacterium]|nr:alpha/beta hydrolase [Ktedonobacteraceae bacterium]
MRVKSLFVYSAVIAAFCAGIVTKQRYHRWQQQQRKRLSSESHMLETTRGIIEYQMEGTGRVVLIFHGSPGGYDQGLAMARFLGLSDFAILTLSRPGYRRTPLNSGKTPESQADLFAATLDALNVSQVVVIAHSGGGPAALQFALRYPQRCRGLLLLSALSQNYTEEGVYRSLPLLRRLLKQLIDHLMIFDPLLYPLTFLSKCLPEEMHSREFIESLVMNPLSSLGYVNDMAQFEELAVYPLQDIVLPTLIVHGTADVDIPFNQAQELADAIPCAQLVAVEGAHHLSTLTSEQAIIAIRCFLQKLVHSTDSRTEEGSLAED